MDRTSDTFDELAEFNSPRWVLLRAVLLKVRQTDPTFDSESILLFSLLRLLNPNLFRKEEALELMDPVLTDLPRLTELIEPLRGVGSPLLLPGGVSRRRSVLDGRGI